jgi:hypothetical protein
MLIGNTRSLSQKASTTRLLAMNGVNARSLVVFVSMGSPGLQICSFLGNQLL